MLAQSYQQQIYKNIGKSKLASLLSKKRAFSLWAAFSGAGHKE